MTVTEIVSEMEEWEAVSDAERADIKKWNVK